MGERILARRAVLRMTLPNPRLIAGRGGAGTTTRSPAGITDSVPDPDVRSARS